MSSEGLLPPPKTLLEDPLITHQRTLVGGGPSNQYQRSLASLDRPVMGNFENSSLKVISLVHEMHTYKIFFPFHKVCFIRL